MQVLFDPSFWHANGKISREWSAALELILDEVIAGKLCITQRTEHWLNIGDGVPIWISNYPYAYGSVAGNSYLPTRRVRKKLHAVVAAYDAQQSLKNMKPENMVSLDKVRSEIYGGAYRK